jgi:3D (Asp-Asp-Asp) domain-containing protein
MPTAGRGSGIAAASSALVLALTLVVPARAASDCPSRTMRISFYTCAEGFRHCLTKRGHQPIPFRTVAVGDRALLGRWIYVQDLGGWVHASDTGSALRRDWLDVFIGESRMAPFAQRLGIQHWAVQVCPLSVADVAPDKPPTGRPTGVRENALGRPRSGERGGGGERQLENERGAATLALAGRVHPPPVQPDHAEGDGEAEAGSFRSDPRR